MNTQTTHTPGPWKVEPRQWDQGASLAIVAPHNGWIVAIVPFDEDIQTEDEPDMTTVKRHPDEEPNAHLIAAAPAMYEALKAVQDTLVGRGLISHDPEMNALFNLNAQAIALAEGK